MFGRVAGVPIHRAVRDRHRAISAHYGDPQQLLQVWAIVLGVPMLDRQHGAIPEAAERERRRFVRAFNELGFPLPGSISERMQRCGRKHCVYWRDSRHLHGPYLLWSRTVKDRTVSQVRVPEQLRHYQPWCDDGRRLRELAQERNNLSLTMIRILEGGA